MPASRILFDVAPLVPVDGYTDSVKPGIMEYGTEFMGGAIDHFFGFLYGWTDRFALQVRGAEGTTRSIEVDAVDYATWQEIASPGERRYSRNFDTSVHFEILPGGHTAVLRIDTFVNYRNNADPVAILGPHFEAAREAGVERLVLDLRRCGGGSTEVPVTLMKYVIDEPFVLAARPNEVRAYRFGDLRPHMTTWQQEALDAPDEAFEARDDEWFVALDPRVSAGLEPIAPFDAETRFDGELVVLCGPANASGATNLLAWLRQNREVTFAGKPTGGSLEGPTSGLIFFVKLPNSGITIRLPWFRQFNAVDVEDPGRAIVPDVWLATTRAHWLAGRDPAMEWLRRTSGDSWVVFSSSRSGDGDIYGIDPTTGDAVLLIGTDAGEGGVRYDAFRNRLVHARYEGDSAVLVSNGKVLFDEPSGDSPPVWSPDGEWIAYAARRNGQEDLYLARPDGTGTRALTSDPEPDRYPAWSPDGRRLVFARQLDTGWDLHVATIGEPSLERLTEKGTYVGHPAWSPDGTRIAFDARFDGQTEIVVLDLGTGAIKRLTDRPGNDLVPSWSPAGDQIVFGADPGDGNWDLWSVDVQTLELVRLTESPGFDGGAVFVPGSALPSP